jgi:predicted RNase H-like HicB family nuclease
MSLDHYTYRVTWSSEDGEHVGLCAEFPSLSWLAQTPEEARAGIRRVR